MENQEKNEKTSERRAKINQVNSSYQMGLSLVYFMSNGVKKNPERFPGRHVRMFGMAHGPWTMTNLSSWAD